MNSETVSEATEMPTKGPVGGGGEALRQVTRSRRQRHQSHPCEGWNKSRGRRCHAWAKRNHLFCVFHLPRSRFGIRDSREPAVVFIPSPPEIQVQTRIETRFLMAPPGPPSRTVEPVNLIPEPLEVKKPEPVVIPRGGVLDSTCRRLMQASEAITPEAIRKANANLEAASAELQRAIPLRASDIPALLKRFRAASEECALLLARTQSVQGLAWMLIQEMDKGLHPYPHQNAES